MPALFRSCALALVGLAAPIFPSELLRFDFNDPAHLAAQAGALPAGQAGGSVAPSATAGAADFSGGFIEVPGFRGPQGPFTIEARFKLRAFGPESSRFVADLLNTATWDIGPTQGFDFRVGGGYLYPVLPREGYRTEAEWQAAQGDYSYIDRGRMSDCFAAFVIARSDDARNWKQAFADRCIEPGVWTHMAAVWDGTGMRVYLDGLDATDKWRLDGVGKPLRIDTSETAFVGARYDGDFDSRRLDGEIDFVKVEDRALTPAEIHARYKETFAAGQRDNLCMGVALPDYPEAGQICKGRVKVEIKVLNHGACTDTAFTAGFRSGDTVEIEFSKDPAFTVIAARVKASTTAFDLGPKDLEGLAGYAGAVYWRVRLLPHAALPALAKAAAETDAEWSPARPIVLDLSGTTALARPAHRRIRAKAGLLRRDGNGASRLYDLQGQRIPARGIPPAR